jgi:hypothetical protein
MPVSPKKENYQSYMHIIKHNQMKTCFWSNPGAWENHFLISLSSGYHFSLSVIYLYPYLLVSKMEALSTDFLPR